MQNRPPLALNDKQLRFLQSAASSVPHALRDQFLRNVSSHLFGAPSDAALTAAINAALDRVPTSVFLCDAKPEGER